MVFGRKAGFLAEGEDVAGIQGETGGDRGISQVGCSFFGGPNRGGAEAAELSTEPEQEEAGVDMDGIDLGDPF
jgi:hypothetical protein